MTTSIHDIVKRKRKELKLTQKELCMRSGVGLRFLRELEHGKKTLKMDKVDQVLHFLGYELGAVEIIVLNIVQEGIIEDIASI
jgi:y4mF family transcriptional regulator